MNDEEQSEKMTPSDWQFLRALGTTLLGGITLIIAYQGVFALLVIIQMIIAAKLGLDAGNLLLIVLYGNIAAFIRWQVYRFISKHSPKPERPGV